MAGKEIKFPPCKDCTDRWLKVEAGEVDICHAHCEKYKKWASNERQRKRWAKEYKKMMQEKEKQEEWKDG